MSQKIAAGTDKAFDHEVTTTADPKAVWRLWTDVSTWQDWDKGLKNAELDGPFETGARGKIIPLSGPSSNFEVTAVEATKSCTFVTSLPPCPT